MKLLAFSDLHGDLDRARRLVEMAADADVVAAAGDLAVIHRGLDETVAALAGIGKPAVLVPGNNETDRELRDACSGWPQASVLHGEAAEVAGTPFFGLGGGVPTTPWDWSFDLAESEAEALLAGWGGGGVLVVHSPPRGHLDGRGGTRLGSEAILQAIESKKPELVLCGHIHECWGEESAIGSTRVVNPGPDGTIVEI